MPFQTTLQLYNLFWNGSQPTGTHCGRVEWMQPADAPSVAEIRSSIEVTHDTRTGTVTKSVCPLDCPDTCSMRVTVVDGVATELKGDPEHPFTRGFLCQKMARFLDRVHSPDRLLYPLRRVGP